MPRLEAELLLMEATRLTREQLTAWPEHELGAEELARFQTLLKRRLNGEPMAYIRGRQAFWTLDLQVTPDTLIPRPDTELLVETALALLAADAPLVVADAGTGSGAIAAALAVERPAWTLIAIERSAAATAVAAANLTRCARDNTRLVRGDWLAPIAVACLDAVIGNPPYIREGDPHLSRGDLPREPALSLTGGPDGMDALRRITRQSVTCLKPGGLLALEHGFDQADQVRSLMAEHGLRGVRTHLDLAGHPRVSAGWRRA
jgi:release factor glutamine methyltransferase